MQGTARGDISDVIFKHDYSVILSQRPEVTKAEGATAATAIDVSRRPSKSADFCPFYGVT